MVGTWPPLRSALIDLKCSEGASGLFAYLVLFHHRRFDQPESEGVLERAMNIELVKVDRIQFEFFCCCCWFVQQFQVRAYVLISRESQTDEIVCTGYAKGVVSTK